MAISKDTMGILAEVLDERMKQIGKGFDPDLDDGHRRGELAQAGAALALAAITRQESELRQALPTGFPGPIPWPFGDALENETPNKPVRAGLIVAVAMLVAEVERLDRLHASGQLEYCEGGHLVWADDAISDGEGVVFCPACAAEQGVALAQDTDPVSRFLRDCCDRSTQARVTAKDLYEAFQRWCREVAGIPDDGIMPIKLFSDELGERPFTEQVRAFGEIYWFGLELREVAA